ncbi:carboxypeptidase B-like [Styela clava]
MFDINLSTKFVLLQFVTGCICLHDIYKGNQVWRVKADTAYDIKLMNDLSLHPDIEIERHRTLANHDTFDLHVSKDNLNKVQYLINSVGLSHRVIVHDVKTKLDFEDLRNKRRKKRSIEKLPEFNYTVYHPLNEIEQWMDLMAAKYTFVEKFKIGSSTEGRPVHGLYVAKNFNNNNPVFYMDATTHAREWISSATLMFVCNQVLSNASYSSLLENLDFYFVPVVNVDGYSYSWTDARLWRKTRTPYIDNETGETCYGADANRNWDVNFKGQGASDKPCSIVYHGPHAESEPVIHHLANFVRREKSKIKALVSFHNYGQQILYPYNHNLTLIPRTEKELNDTAFEMKLAIESVHGSTYEHGRGSVTMYVFSGSTSDWAYEKAEIELSYTLELRDQWGPFYFELPADQIKPTSEEIMAGIEVLANTVINKHKKS